MNDHELEELMREYEAEVAAYKRLPQSEPTALLDRAVLTKARAAVAHPHRAPSWMALAASFAGIAIAAGVGWRVHEASQMSREGTNQAAAARPQAFEVQVLPSGTRDREKAIEMGQLPLPPPPPAAPPAPQPPKAGKEASAFANEGAKQEAAAPEPILEEQLAAPVLRDAELEPHVRSDHAMRGGAPEQRQNMAAPATSTAVPESAPAAAAERAGLSRSQDERKLSKRAAAGRSEADALGAVAQDKDDAAGYTDAEDWLRHIRRLIRERRISEAQTELQRFRQAFPDEVVPADLRRYQR